MILLAQRLRQTREELGAHPLTEDLLDAEKLIEDAEDRLREATKLGNDLLIQAKAVIC